MANTKEKTYWPHMILGFLFIGIFLGFWTIKSAINLPVHESNEYLLKYQVADMNINDIMEAQERFDKQYIIEPIGFELSDVTPKYIKKRKRNPVIKLERSNHLTYAIRTIDGAPVNDANVTFLLTRPHSRVYDQSFYDLKVQNGRYAIPEVTLESTGRYQLRLRVQKGDAVGMIEHEAYLKP